MKNKTLIRTSFTPTLISNGHFIVVVLMKFGLFAVCDNVASEESVNECKGWGPATQIWVSGPSW